jgi:diaminopimelate epimerase
MTDTLAFGAPASGRQFIKMHGLENHFVIVDGRADRWRPGTDEIVHICNPKTGVGGDQLIIVEPPTEAGFEAGAVAFMRILNVDGREVEACGNATRCVAWLLLEEIDSDELIVETLAGLIDCRRTNDREVACTMGKVSMDWQQVPLSREVDTCHVDLDAGPLADGVALNIGNPHIVFFVDDVDAVDLESHAPAIQKNELFPDEVNVGIATLVAADHLRSTVYERGAGLTTACGSGACAAAYAALARGLTDKREIRVSMPAGDVTIAIGEDGVATMTGPVAYSYSGYLLMPDDE